MLRERAELEMARKCKVCGSTNVVAKIGGDYYCAKCGMSVVLEHSRKIVNEYVKKYLGEE